MNHRLRRSSAEMILKAILHQRQIIDFSSALAKFSGVPAFREFANLFTLTESVN